MGAAHLQELDIAHVQEVGFPLTDLWKYEGNIINRRKSLKYLDLTDKRLHQDFGRNGGKLLEYVGEVV